MRVTTVVYPGGETRVNIVSDVPVRVQSDRSYLTEDSKIKPPSEQGFDASENIATKKPDRRKRQARFGNAQKNLLRRAGAAMETECPPEETLFITATHPGGTKESFAALAASSTKVINRLKSWLHKYIRTNHHFYSWEWQRRGALHLHYAVHVPKSEHRRLIADKFNSWWAKQMDAIGEEFGIDMWKRKAGGSHKDNKGVLQTKVEEVKQSVARYLSKYLGKSTSAGKGAAAWFFKPRKWYGISESLHALLRKLTVRKDVSNIPRRVAERLYEDYLSLLQPYANRCYQYGHRVGIGKTLIALFTTQEEAMSCLNKPSQSDTEMKTSSQSMTRRLLTCLLEAKVLLKRRPAFAKEFQSRWPDSVHTLENLSSHSCSLEQWEMVNLVLALSWSAYWVLRLSPYQNSALASFYRRTEMMRRELSGSAYNPDPSVPLRGTGTEGVDTDPAANLLCTQEHPTAHGRSASRVGRGYTGEQLELWS